MQNGDAYANLQETAAPEGAAAQVAGVPRQPVLREPAVVVPIEEYRRAEVAAAMEEYREWSAAGRPGAITHAEAKRLLLGESG